MSKNVTAHACAALNRSLEGSTPVTTRKIYQETQVSPVESNVLVCNDDTETHEEDQSHAGDEICDDGGKRVCEFEHPEGEEVEYHSDFDVCLTNFEGQEFDTFKRTRMTLEKWSASHGFAVKG